MVVVVVVVVVKSKPFRDSIRILSGQSDWAKDNNDWFVKYN